MPRFNPDQHDSQQPTESVRPARTSFAGLRRRLRGKLIAAYLIPLAVLSFFFHREYTATIRDGIHDHLQSVAESQRATVDLYLRERVADLRGVFLGEPAGGAPAALDLDQLLGQLRGQTSAFVDVGLFDADGTLVSYAGPHRTLVGKDYHEERWWNRLLTQGRDYHVSDVYLGFRREPHFIVAVRRVHEGRAWVLRASVDPQRFTEFVQGSHLAGNTRTVIVNARGERQTAVRGQAENEPRNWAPARASETQVREVVGEQGRVLAAVAWLHETDWALVASVPLAEAYAPLRRARWILAGLMLAALALLSGIVFRYTARSVAQLESTGRARDKLQSQLFHAAKLASVGEMAAGIAHEINNPLAIVYEEAGMMRDTLDPEFKRDLDPDEFRERLDAIVEATLRGRSITSKLLAFSRQHEPVPAPIDANVVVEAALEVKARSFALADIEVEKELADGLPQVLMNRNHLEQVLLNLLNNARDAISGRGRVTARTRLVDRWVEIEVEDSGCGMSTEQMQHIFFPFYTTKGVGKGTGLGLSISYGIVKSASGQIEVQSEVGAGTTMTVRLPVHKAKPGLAPQSDAGTSGASDV